MTKPLNNGIFLLSVWGWEFLPGMEEVFDHVIVTKHSEGNTKFFFFEGEGGC